jgi:surfactin synthase thioesterase subunit
MGAHVYHAWQPPLARHGIEVVALEPPGRNSRLREPPAGSLVALGAEVAEMVARLAAGR